MKETENDVRSSTYHLYFLKSKSPMLNTNMLTKIHMPEYTLYNSPKLETIQISINRRTNKWHCVQWNTIQQ